MRIVRLFPVLAAFLLVSGCGSLFKVTCAKPADFASAEEKPALKIPPGYDAPDTRAALTIPPLEAPEAPRPADAPCLDTPPKFNPAPPRRPQA
ncbi:MAG: hypothetical protein ACKO42_07415 [Gammaproteobacteria bacterium]